MNKKNIITILLLCMSMVVVICISTIINIVEQKKIQEISKANAIAVVNEKKATSKDKKVKKEKVEQTKKDQQELANSSNLIGNELPSKPITMNDALFIGDSRTVGLMEYSAMEGAQYFCSVGMSVFNIYDQVISVPEIGKVSLDSLLSNKTYHKIYIMLGINEMGYRFDRIVDNYRNLVEFVRSKQKDAMIIIQGNLHVTKSRSDQDPVFNNTMINKLNAEIKKFSKQKNMFYIDVNSFFDDGNGALPEDKSEDQTHLYAKYYIDWGNWIVSQTAMLLEG